MRLRTRMLASCITHLYRFIAFLILDREVCHVQLFLKVPQSQSSTCCYGFPLLSEYFLAKTRIGPCQALVPISDTDDSGIITK